MPSTSKTQQRLMGVAYAVKKGDMKLSEVDADYRDKVRELVDGMTLKQLKDFASTKHEGLPEVAENISLDSVTGMGPIKLPTSTELGSGDVPAGQGDAEEEYKKKRRKMKYIKTFESFESKVNEANDETLIFDADSVRRQLKRQNASDDSIEKYIKLNTKDAKPGQYYYQSVASPGIGKFAYKITRVKNGNIWGVYDPNKSTVRDLDIWDEM